MNTIEKDKTRTTQVDNFNILFIFPNYSGIPVMRLKGNGNFLPKYSHFLSIQFPSVLPHNYSLSTHNKEKIT